MLQVYFSVSRGSYEPRPLRSAQIWNIAGEVRRQILRGRRRTALEVKELVEESRKLVVNGIVLNAHWDLGRQLPNGALGLTEADSVLPGTVLIGINGSMIAGREYLLRSTVAHELGHALFDGLWMVQQESRASFATPDEAHLTKPARTGERADWREFRANEFMGALLVPRATLHGALVRTSVSLGLPLFDRGEDLPVPRLTGQVERAEHLLLELAERFGVSPEFIRYRLRRYTLVT